MIYEKLIFCDRDHVIVVNLPKIRKTEILDLTHLYQLVKFNVEWCILRNIDWHGLSRRGSRVRVPSTPPFLLKKAT